METRSKLQSKNSRSENWQNRIGHKRVHQEINAGILTWRTGQSGPEGMERAALIPERRRETMTHRCRHNGGRTGEEEERPHGKTNQKTSQEPIKAAKTNQPLDPSEPVLCFSRPFEEVNAWWSWLLLLLTPLCLRWVNKQHFTPFPSKYTSGWSPWYAAEMLSPGIWFGSTVFSLLSEPSSPTGLVSVVINSQLTIRWQFFHPVTQRSSCSRRWEAFPGF